MRLAITPQQIETDKVFGYCASPYAREAVFNAARNMDGTFLIEGDFLNQTGMNNAIGRERGNRFMRMVAGILEDELSQIPQENCFISRKNADELSIIISGAHEDDLQNALSRATEKIDRFAEDSGLAALQHHKHPQKTGIGYPVAYTPITPSSEEFLELVDTLQDDIYAKKMAVPNKEPEEIRPDTSYHDEHSLNRFDTLIGNPDWAGYAPTPTQYPQSLSMIANINSNLPLFKSNVLGREQRFHDLNSAMRSDKTGTLMRLDLYNLAGLNSVLGRIGTDQVRDDIFNIAREELQTAFPEATMYGETDKEGRVASGLLDVILPDAADTQIDDLKTTIQERLYSEVLSKTVAEYDFESLKDGMEDKIIGELPYKTGTHNGVGLIMAHTEIPQNSSPAALLERIDSITTIQKLYGCSFLTETSTNTLQAYNIGSNVDAFEEIPTKEGQSPHSLPYAAALKNRLSPHDTQAQFTKFTGLVT